ncbi:MBL fold metallo-hydrolase [Halococcus saccharolyticus]|uniref:Metallo-beta-lactamase n=1 Tax=Halococcus saccharolyticus DSM 5350 TaxID=1227455 RepID=M0MKG6_9EURY|nr:MBL fold metallo-hydrolase [Halococcus saccharolyticus]EMA46146.1 metallo-beta-lactamase [Halococcus saccharolyticus DSM 5350]
MVHSTWGDWFVRDEIEATEPQGLSVWYLGCNGYVLRTAETTVYLDPYFGDGTPPRTIRMIPVPIDPADATLCDAVLVTHEHIDHTHPPSYGPLVEDCGAEIHAPSASYERPDYDGDLRAPDDKRHIIEPGDEFDVGDLTIHVRGANDPDAIEPVSYVVEHDAGTFFAAGDSRPADAFTDVAGEFDLDLGVLAFGSVGNIVHTEDDPTEARPTEWYNDGDQVATAANQLELHRLVPVHWDMWRGVGADPDAIADHVASYRYPNVVETVRIGDRLDVGEPGVVPLRDVREH